MLRILALFAAVAAGCAHPGQRPPAEWLGSLDVMSADITHAEQRARFIDVNADGFELTWVGGFAQFHAAEGKDPCATAVIRDSAERRVELCPQGEGRWHAAIDVRTVRGPAPRDGFDYGATKLPDGCISVERLGATWSVEIADHSAASEVIRQHPELIGAAVALRLLPLHHENNITLVGAR